MRILLVDDDESFSQLLKAKLVDQYYIIDIAKDALEARDFLKISGYDLIVLDVILPKIDGISFCRQLRAEGLQIPILLLTVRSLSDDKVIGLDAGADDYVVKSEPLAELSARIRALLRRKVVKVSPILLWGNLQLNSNHCEVKYGDTLLNLTFKEYALLELFMQNQQAIHSQSVILNQLWSLDDKAASSDTVRTLVKRLRNKLKAAGAENIIETLYGMGYRLNPELQEVQITTGEDHVINEESTSNVVLEDSQSVIIAQIQALIQAMQEFKNGSLSNKSRISAKQKAHKLIGSLSIINFPKATKIARKIESILEDKKTLKSEQINLLINQAKFLRSLVQNNPTRSLSSRTNQTAIVDQSKAAKAKIMILDDDKLILQLLQELLEPWGFKVFTLANPHFFWEQVEKINPDLLILDIQIPNFDGIELCQILRHHNQWNYLPILFLTGNIDTKVIQKVFDAGADDYINKPVVGAELIKRICNSLEQRDLAL